MYAINRLKPLGKFDDNASMDYWEEVTADDGYTQYYNHTTGEYYTSLPAAEDSGVATDGTSMSSQRKTSVEEALPTGGEATRTPQEMKPWNGVEGKVFAPWSEGEGRGMGASPIAIGSVGEIPEPVADCEGYESETQVLPPRGCV